MCKEGGCGACIVTMTTTNPATGRERSYGVNSCLVPILSCQGAKITTIEGIGNNQMGYSKEQKAIYTFNGTQCGYCTPGQVMNMHSLLRANPKIKMEEVENSFGGSICRCTGYRPILDGFKSLADDASNDLRMKLEDIEDSIGKCNRDCQNDCKDCSKNIDKEHDDFSDLFLETLMASKVVNISLRDNAKWYRVSDISQIFQIFDMIGSAKYMLVAGNTAQGVYPDDEPPDVYIDIGDVRALKTVSISQQRIILGANITLNDMKTLFNRTSSDDPSLFGYTKALAEHIDLVANVPVRNIGTLAGNLMTKHRHRDFGSDIFLIMETCGARITIRDQSGSDETISLLEFLEKDMTKKVVISLTLPALRSSNYVFRSFKIMPRRQNVHALMNAGFLFKIKESNKYTVEERPNIVFGSVGPNFVHASNTENLLRGKSLLNAQVLEEAKSTLSKEINPVDEPPEASPEYKRMLSIALFYRFILQLNENLSNKVNRSGAYNLMRPLSSGKQEFPVNTSEAPVHLPKLKFEGLIQSSGEAEYVDDIPYRAGELHGALVITDRAVAKITNIDASPALKIPGVVAFYSAKDIPGKNSFATFSLLAPEDEELFCSGPVKYAGQPVGIIVAKTHDLAIKAAKMVKIEYSNEKKPLLTVKEVLASGDITRLFLSGVIVPTKINVLFKHKINGEFELGPQYHFTMELQTCLCVPLSDGMDIHTSSQFMDFVQKGVANVLGINLNKINIFVKRLGGAYGSKLTRSAMIACACSVAAHKLQKPVRLVLDMRTNTKAVGKRGAYLAKYEVGVNEKGKILALKVNFYENFGCSFNENDVPLTIDGIESCYDKSTWTVNGFLVKTDVAGTCYARAPGTVQGIATIEHIMDHIATVCDLDPLSVRRANFSEEYSASAEKILKDALSSSNYEKSLAAVNQFNKDNRWKKRGISVLPLRFGINFYPNYYAIISIFSDDGTVAITSGGIEMGQGLNTKVVQVVAYALGINMNKIQTKVCYNNVAPNQFISAASIASDSTAAAALKCCEELNKRLKPIKDTLGSNPPWELVVRTASAAGVDLMATYMYSPLKDPIPARYEVFGTTVLDIELDVLTGQHQITRATIVEDAGESMSPGLDIGQVEGAFTMGQGFFTFEEIEYRKDNGVLLTDRTWNYYVPGAKDIPIFSHVILQKNSSNPKGVLRSKTTGEPPLAMAFSIVMALRNAVRSARKDAGISDGWFSFNPPCTFEKTALASGTTLPQLVIP
nr:xanthine dehydrogenase-like isoform X2 [Halyomorpha halys]